MPALAPIETPPAPTQGPSLRRQEIYRSYARGEVTLEDAADRAAEVSQQRDDSDRNAVFIGLVVTSLLLILFGKKD